ncbi:MAG: PPC domain-containing DNA-binding protein [Candidatus Hodarchaeales archaeon]
MFYSQQNIQKVVTIRLRKGEDILTSIQRFCLEDKELTTGIVQGIGAVSEIVIGYYTGEVYHENKFKENLEILSLTGNIAKENIVHLHGIFGRKNGTTIGGHILPRCIVSFTCEIHILYLKPSMTRKLDPETRLNLLNLTNELDLN